MKKLRSLWWKYFGKKGIYIDGKRIDQPVTKYRSEIGMTGYGRIDGSKIYSGYGE